MASYVEQAILRVKDDSTVAIKRINKELASLFRTAKSGRDIKIKVTGLDRATKDAVQLRSALMKLPTSRTVKLGMTGGSTKAIKDMMALAKSLDKQKITVPVDMPGMPKALSELREMRDLVNAVNRKAVGPRVTGPRTGNAGGLGSPYGAFPGNLLSTLNYELAHLTIRAAAVTLNAASVAGLEGQAAETNREIVINDPVVQALIESLARDAAAGSDRISLTRAEQIVQDLYVGGLRGDELTTLAPAIVEQESTAILLGANAEAAKQLTMLANKVLNLANATEDTQRSLEIMAGVQAGAIVQGESFNAATSLAALRTAGFANTITGEGLVGFALATDALGQRAGSSLMRLDKELRTPLKQAGAGAGIAKGSVKSLIKSGIRGENGLTEEQNRRFMADPILFIQTDIKAALEAQGVDTSDRVAVKEAIGKAGFAGTSQRLITDALSAIAETEKARALAGNIAEPETANLAAADDLGAALKNLTASFNTFSSEVLDPIFSSLAPVVNSLAEGLEGLGLDDGTTGQIKRLGVVAGVAATALAGLGLVKFTGNKLLGMIGAGPALTAAAGELTVAAVALQRAAGVQAGTGTAGAAAGGAAAFLRGLAQKAATAYAGYVGASAVVEGNKRASQLTPDEIDTLDRGLKDVLFRWTGGMMGTSAGETDGRRAVAPGDHVGLSSQGPSMLSEIIRPAFFQDAAKPMQETFSTGATQMQTTFSTGATEIMQAGTAIDLAASQFGPIAGAGLLAVADQFGQRVAAAIGNVGVTVNQPALLPAPRMDTGTSRPF